jgi:putative acetyltransferase
MRIRRSRRDEVPRLLDLWRASVRATHDFLAPADFVELEHLVATRYLPEAELLLAVDAADRPLAFMGLTGSHLDSLFVDPACRGGGLGRALVGHAASLHPRLTVDVNEQNAQAVGFYAHLGFRRIGRSDTDDAGRPYPLLHLQRGG